MTVETESARRVVDRYEALPLLDCEGFCRVDAEAHSFTLGVECIEIYMRDHSERCLRAV